ncbi:E3 ubiquitin-protein ligase SH3RF1-like [Saccoglossus kowalevskii]|uniref:E3 ubiquitin-protein ligase SH3RF1-like n=1 Tax=Saccoglossus kowalevskii TaxID=10224 RepID=A0ABM0MY80_SACKO|nr:PREDICTED: E3 ubiquitin-protein ligase SH3RF1-like [Saccoglossus kowalevskii]
MESGCQVQAIYDFKGTEPSELTLNTGDIIEVVSKLNDNWLQGTHNGVTGAFPSNFVTLLSNNTPKQVTAIEEFIATSNGDLGFQKGDIITVLDKVDDNWWRGQIGNTTGIFPVTYVQEHTSNNSQGDAALQTVKALQDVTGQLQEGTNF